MPADSDIEIEKCSFIFLPHSAQLSSAQASQALFVGFPPMKCLANKTYLVEQSEHLNF